MFRWSTSRVAELIAFGNTFRVPLQPGREPDAPAPGAQTSETSDMPAALQALRSAGGRTRTRLQVWLGGARLYQATVPVDAAGLARDALRSVLSAHWTATLGEGAGPLAVAWSIQPGGRSVVTTCSPELLMHEIRDAAQACGFRLAGLAPFSARVWNAHRRSIVDRSGLFVVCEPAFVSVGAFVDGAWLAWAGHTCDTGNWHEVARSVRRFARYHGLDEALPVWIYPDAAVPLPPAGGDWEDWRVLADAPSAREPVQ